MAEHKPPQCGRCAHRNYLLTCDDYDALVAAHDARCAICKRSGPETAHGHLCIDHDPFVGQWAVRGLLRSRCNGQVDAPWVTAPEYAAYRAESWYLHWLPGKGVTIAAMLEPPQGARIAVNGRTWRRGQRGWVCSLKNAKCDAISWREINRRFGPYNVSRVA